jgi:outer membrane protein OmpA-like peptidoglycan-associated protein
MRKRLFSLFLVVLLAAVLSACFGTIPVQEPTPTWTPLPVDDSSPENGVQPEQPAVQEPQTDQGSDSSDQQASAELPVLPEMGFAFGETELQASDPNQLDLTSGGPYLVELFAFW